MIIISTNINKRNNYLSPETIEHEKDHDMRGVIKKFKKV